MSPFGSLILCLFVLNVVNRGAAKKDGSKFDACDEKSSVIERGKAAELGAQFLNLCAWPVFKKYKFSPRLLQKFHYAVSLVFRSSTHLGGENPLRLILRACDEPTGEEGKTLDRFKPKRTTQWALQKEQMNEVKVALQCPTPDLVCLQSLLERLNEFDDDLRAIISELDQLIHMKMFKTDIQTVLQYEDEAISALGILKTIIKTPKNKETSSNRHSIYLNSASENDLQSAIRSSCPRLPRPEKLTFRGEISKGLLFWELFEAMINKNNELATTDKFHYSRNYLSKRLREPLLTFSQQKHPTKIPSTCCAQGSVIISTGNKNIFIDCDPGHLSSLRLALPEFEHFPTVCKVMSLYKKLYLHRTTSYTSMVTDVLLRSVPPDKVIKYHRRRAAFKLPTDSTGE